ncbi:MAG: MarR family transcriptional regulator [Eubacteriales bacterium]|nr:MarR family transcriptional regulator [Eubacteriales bacterium]
MNQAIDFLLNMRRIIKLQESMLKEICQKYSLTLTEATVVNFLHNNPGKDTAADIVDLRMLQKGNVSQAVDSLVKKGLLQRKQDEEDRRRIHLFLTEDTKEMIESLDDLWRQFETEMMTGITEEERQIFHRVNGKMKENMQEMARRKQIEG